MRRRHGPPVLIPHGPVIVTRAKALTVLLILTCVFVAAVAYLVWLNGQTRATSRRLEQVQAQQHTVIVNRRRDQQQVTLLICMKVNNSNRILADLLRELERIPPPAKTSTQAQRNRNELLHEFAGALLRLKPQNCQKLADPHTKGTP